MNRREFLQSTLGACSAIWLGQNLLSAYSAAAGEELTKLLKIYSGFKNPAGSSQNYFWLELMISSDCEIVQSQTSCEFVFLLKNCRPVDLTGQINYTNPYIKRVEVKAANQQDSSIRLVFKNPNAVPEMRYALIPSLLHPGRYWLRIDVGSFSGPTAMKEKNLGIQETNLAFGPLETRASTSLIVIHHVGMGDVDISAAEIHRMHLANGWSGIGYHYVIHKNGMIERGRPRDTVGAHTYKYNESSIGIVLDGNFEDSMPTAVQVERAAMLVAALSHIYNIRPDNTSLLGHRDLNATLCPGINLYVQLPQLREKARAYLQQ
ncbi:n-acetylmuramoyl-l-alanine amidase [Lucifera butyrica]|uniref:N-acetylmuramoyl-l-alanine amidase n=2 Tax=Lucifera butyrica TaxID=1351585 RepID=A0A498RKF4_9FIRM|nr:n-acetylmuramoyl-l-alanine amidase [Lucifera butyrica]